MYSGRNRDAGQGEGYDRGRLGGRRRRLIALVDRSYLTAICHGAVNGRADVSFLYVNNGAHTLSLPWPNGRMIICVLGQVSIYLSTLILSSQTSLRAKLATTSPAHAALIAY